MSGCLDPFLARKLGFVVLVLLVNLGDGAVGSLWQPTIDKEDSNEDHTGKESKAPTERGGSCVWEDRSNDCRPEPIGEGCETIGLTTLTKREHFSADDLKKEDGKQNVLGIHIISSTTFSWLD